MRRVAADEALEGKVPHNLLQMAFLTRGMLLLGWSPIRPHSPVDTAELAEGLALREVRFSVPKS